MTIRSKLFGSAIDSNLKMLEFSMFGRPMLFKSSKELSEDLKINWISNTIKIYFYTLIFF